MIFCANDHWREDYLDPASKTSNASEVPVFERRKEGFPGIYGKKNAQTPSRTMTFSRHPLRSEPMGARALVLRSYTAGGR